MSGKFHANLNFSGSVVLDKHIFKAFTCIKNCKTNFPYHPFPQRGTLVCFFKLDSELYISKFLCKFETSGTIALKKVYEGFCCTIICTNNSPFCGTILFQGPSLWRTSLLTMLRWFRSEVFCLVSLWEEHFQFSPYINTCKTSSHIVAPPYPRWSWF
jgi:hypothetical protein